VMLEGVDGRELGDPPATLARAWNDGPLRVPGRSSEVGVKRPFVLLLKNKGEVEIGVVVAGEMGRGDRCRAVEEDELLR